MGRIAYVKCYSVYCLLVASPCVTSSSAQLHRFYRVHSSALAMFVFFFFLFFFFSLLCFLRWIPFFLDNKLCIEFLTVHLMLSGRNNWSIFPCAMFTVYLVLHIHVCSGYATATVYISYGATSSKGSETKAKKRRCIAKQCRKNRNASKIEPTSRCKGFCSLQQRSACTICTVRTHRPVVSQYIRDKHYYHHHHHRHRGRRHQNRIEFVVQNSGEKKIDIETLNWRWCSSISWATHASQYMHSHVGVSQWRSSKVSLVLLHTGDAIENAIKMSLFANKYTQRTVRWRSLI